MKLFESFKLGPNKLKNRMVMAPMTRGRAIDGNIPNPLASKYYSERASTGLIVTEATQVSSQGIGYPSHSWYLHGGANRRLEEGDGFGASGRGYYFLTTLACRQNFASGFS